MGQNSKIFIGFAKFAQIAKQIWQKLSFWAKPKIITFVQSKFFCVVSNFFFKTIKYVRKLLIVKSGNLDEEQLSAECRPHFRDLMNSASSDFSAFPGNCQLNILKNCLKVFLRFDDSFVQLFPENGVVADDGLVA